MRHPALPTHPFPLSCATPLQILEMVFSSQPDLNIRTQSYCTRWVGCWAGCLVPGCGGGLLAVWTLPCASSQGRGSARCFFLRYLRIAATHASCFAHAMTLIPCSQTPAVPASPRPCCNALFPELSLSACCIASLVCSLRYISCSVATLATLATLACPFFLCVVFLLLGWPGRGTARQPHDRAALCCLAAPSCRGWRAAETL